MRELEERLSLWRSYGIETQEMIAADAIGNYVNTDVYAGGMIDHAGGHLHPLNLALGEAAAFESKGGVIFEHSMVSSVDHAAGKSVVTTKQGSITCKTLVLCGNAYLGGVVPELAKRVMPVSTQVMATEILPPEQAQQLLPTDTCVEDIRYILDYYRLSADNRLLFGGGTVYGGTDPDNIEAKLRRNMDKVFPALQLSLIHI